MDHLTGALQRLRGGHGRHHRAAEEEGGVEGAQVPQSARDHRPREEGAAALPGAFLSCLLLQISCISLVCTRANGLWASDLSLLVYTTEGSEF